MDNLADRFLEQLRTNGHFVAAATFTDERGAAYCLGVTTRTLCTWRLCDVGPEWSRAGRVLYRIEILAAWLNNGGKRTKPPETE